MKTRFFGLVTALIVTLGLTVFVAPAANADGGGTTVTASTASNAKIDARTTGAVQAVIGGRVQTAWEHPEGFKGKLTAKSIRKAPRIRVNAPGANASRVIWRKSGHAPLVVLLPGSRVLNTGHGNVKFVWTVTRPTVAKLTKRGQYVEVAQLLTNAQLAAVKAGSHGKDYVSVGKVKFRGKKLNIVLWCKNRFGGKGHLIVNPIQHRYPGDILMDVSLEAKLLNGSELGAIVTCPNGIKVTINTATWGNLSVRSSIRVAASAVNGKAVIDATAALAATLQSQIDQRLTVNCGGSTPPSVTPAPSLQEISLINMVLVGNKITLTVSGTLVKGHTAELFCTALNGGTIIEGKRQTIDASPFIKSITYVAPGEVPDVLKDKEDNVIVPAGHDRVKCTVTQDDGQIDSIMTEVGPGKFEIIKPIPDPK